MVQLTFSRLRIFNTIIGLFQLITGAAILGIMPYDSRTKLPWYTFFVQSWSRDSAEEAAAFYIPGPKQVVNFPIGIWSGAFLLLSALDHLVVVLPGVNRLYNRLLCANRNPFRFAEYAVSASIMSVMIAQLCGVTDIHLLFTIAALMASTMLFGWQMEVSNGERLPTFAFTDDPKAVPLPANPADRPLPAFLSDSASAPKPGPSGSLAGGSTPVFASAGGAGAAGQPVDWAPFWMGCWPFLAVELVTACYFFQAVANASPPTFVWSLFFILLVLYTLFALNQFLQFKQVKGWRGFAKAEFYYMLLSVTAKQLLAWITYGGTMRFRD